MNIPSRGLLSAMRSIEPRIRVAAALPLLLIAVFSSFARGDDGRISRILADWRNRQRAIERVEYQAEGAAFFAKGDLTKTVLISRQGDVDPNSEFPPKDVSGEKSIKLLLDFTSGRVRKEVREPVFLMDRLAFESRKTLTLFDGEACQQHLPEDENNLGLANANLKLCRKGFSGFVLLVDDYPFFLAHGFLPIQTGPLNPQRGFFVNPFGDPKASHFTQLDSVEEDGRKQTVLRTVPLDRRGSFIDYWVDEDRDSAITKWIYYTGNGEPKYEITLKHHDKDGHWLLDAWTWSRFEGEKLRRVQDMKVTHVDPSPDVSVDRFRIEPAKGMRVYDENTKRYYVHGEPETDLREQIRQLRKSRSAQTR